MKTKENTNAKENINAVGSNSKSTAPNAVCWLDVILFEDNTFEVEIYYVDIVYEFKDEFNKRTFTTIKELDDFFKGEDVIYDCDKYIDYVKEKYKKPFKALLLDNVVVSQEMLDKIEKQCDISKCGGFINGMQY
jgi:predicted RND superfamily exporter protein